MMSKATYPPKLPVSTKTAAAKKIGAVETAASFFKRRTGKAKPADLLWFLDYAPDNAPAHDDE